MKNSSLKSFYLLLLFAHIYIPYTSANEKFKNRLPELLNEKLEGGASIPVACCNATPSCPIGAIVWPCCCWVDCCCCCCCWTDCVLDACWEELEGVKPPDPDPSVERLWLLAARICCKGHFERTRSNDGYSKRVINHGIYKAFYGFDICRPRLGGCISEVHVMQNNATEETILFSSWSCGNTRKRQFERFLELNSSSPTRQSAWLIEVALSVNRLIERK